MATPARKILTEADLPLSVGSSPSTINMTTLGEWVLFAENVYDAKLGTVGINKIAYFTYLPTGQALVPADVSKFQVFKKANPFKSSFSCDLYVWVSSQSLSIEVEV